ncbi:MAG: hypothetical protein NVSMB38_42310 [Ktedonobacteraceae bacterium]
MNEWFAKEWQGIEQVFRLERTVRLLKSGEVRHEVVYGLSSLPLRQVPAARILALVREHWGIENRLHWRRDVTDGEKMRVKRAQDPLPACSLNSIVRH